MTAKPSLVGCWKMADFIICQPDQSETSWIGEHEGSLEYSSDGDVYAHIKLIPAANNPSDASDMWYKGTYEIDEDGETIKHNVSSSSDQDKIGKKLIRHFQLAGNELMITGKNSRIAFKIIWKKEI